MLVFAGDSYRDSSRLNSILLGTGKSSGQHTAERMAIKMKNGIDISHWNKITDWNKVKADFIIHKCTESVNYLDPTYFKNKKEILKKGIIFGSYHFAKSGNPVKEAEWYLKNCGECAMYCLDAEKGQTEEWCKKWLDYVYSKTGKKPYIYAPVKNWKTALDYPLWVARYGPNNGQKNENYPPNIGQWQEWTIWQYASQGKIDGVDGYVDLDIAKNLPSCQDEPIKTGAGTTKIENPPEVIVGYDKASGEIKTAPPDYQELSDPKNQFWQLLEDLCNLLKIIFNKLKK